MKKIYLLFVAASLGACSAESIETEGLDSLDAAVARNNRAEVSTNDVDIRSEWTYTNNGGLNQGKVVVSNDCDSVTLQFVELDGDPLTEVEFEVGTILPQLNNGGNLENGSLSYNFADLDENLSITFTFAELGITHLNDLIVFAKAWGKWAGLSTHGKLSYFTYNVEEISCGCKESFNYNMNDDGTYTFTYIPAEDMDDAQLTFTFPQGHVNLSPDEYAQNGNGNDTTFSTIIDLSACQAYSWTFSLSADCRGQGQTEVNLWTDFKVGDDSKREQFELEKIRKFCN